MVVLCTLKRLSPRRQGLKTPAFPVAGLKTPLMRPMCEQAKWRENEDEHVDIALWSPLTLDPETRYWTYAACNILLV